MKKSLLAGIHPLLLLGGILLGNPIAAQTQGDSLSAEVDSLYATLKADLEALASREEIFYSEHYTYSADPGELGFAPSGGVMVVLDAAKDGWSARATHSDLGEGKGCAFYYGAIAPPTSPVTPSAAGEVFCSDFPGPRAQADPSAITILIDTAAALDDRKAERAFDCSTQSEIPEVECQALVALYEATGGPGWTESTGWLASSTPCSWHGVTCANGAVSRLRLMRKRLTGTIPAELGNLSNLQVLHLSFNQLSGSIPAELGKLGDLVSLGLELNQLTAPIPGELGNLLNLVELHLWSNQLTGPLPPELGGLSSLRHLMLDSNQLTGPIPPEFGSLTQLRILELHSNRLTGPIPGELGNLSNLMSLRLHENQLTGPVPGELGTLSNLRTLQLQSNQLEGLVPLDVAHLGGQLEKSPGGGLCDLAPKRSEGLRLPDTQEYRNADLNGDGEICGLPLPGDPPPTIGVPERREAEGAYDCSVQSQIPEVECQALAALYEATGQLGWMESTTPCSWYGVTCADGAVTGLGLDRNQLTGPIPPELGDLSSLEGLSLGGNRLSGTIPPELGRLRSLEVLRLFNNQLTGPIPPELGNLSNLRMLFLSGNQLSGPVPPELGDLSTLTHLQLFSNQLSGPIPLAVAQLGVTERQCEFLPGNRGLYLPDTPDYRDADLDGDGSICGLGFTAGQTPDDPTGAFDCSMQTQIPEPECEALVALYEATEGPGWTESKGWLAYATPCSWHGVRCQGSVVTGLELYENQLTGPIPPELGNLSNLSNLALASNQLTGPIPPELGDLSDLGILMLSRNQLTCPIPSELGNLAQLRMLYLSNNQLSGPIPPGLGNLVRLGNLDLSSNQLTGPIPPELGDMSNLQLLHLNSNQLTGPIPPELGNLSPLMGLNLSGNQLTGAIPAELGDLSKLVGLTLSDNQLTGPIPPELGNLSPLMGLDLSGNQLTGPIPLELGNLSKLFNLGLSGNQLSDLVPLAVAQRGGQIQEAFRADVCVFIPPGNDGLFMPDAPEYRAADLDGDGLICGLGFTGGLTSTVSAHDYWKVRASHGLAGRRWQKPPTPRP